MTTITPTIDANPDGKHVDVKWLNMGSGDVGDPVGVSSATWRSCQRIGNGTFAVTLQGSNDSGTTWADLLTLTGIPTNLDNRADLVRPACTSGAGTVDVHIACSS